MMKLVAGVKQKIKIFIIYALKNIKFKLYSDEIIILEATAKKTH